MVEKSERQNFFSHKNSSDHNISAEGFVHSVRGISRLGMAKKREKRGGQDEDYDFQSA